MRGFTEQATNRNISAPDDMWTLIDKMAAEANRSRSAEVQIALANHIMNRVEARHLVDTPEQYDAEAE